MFLNRALNLRQYREIMDIYILRELTFSAALKSIANKGERKIVLNREIFSDLINGFIETYGHTDDFRGSKDEIIKCITLLILDRYINFHNNRSLENIVDEINISTKKTKMKISESCIESPDAPCKVCQVCLAINWMKSKDIE